MSEPQDKKTNEAAGTDKTTAPCDQNGSKTNSIPRQIEPPKDFKIPPGLYM